MASLIDRFFSRTRPTGTDGEHVIPHNPAGGEFMDSVKSSIRKSIDKFSVTANSLVLGNNSFNRGGNPFGAAGVLASNTNTDSSFGNTDLGLSLPVDTNKIQRIQSYDNLARYPELDWCINEIANDFLHADINGEYLTLRLKCPDAKFTNGEDTVLQEEFRNLVSMYDLKTTGYNMIRKFLIEGECCFENVIDHNHPEYGVIGFKYMPTMFYDFLRNRQTGQIEGLYLDPERLKTYTQFSAYGGTSYAGQSTTVFNAIRQIPAYSYTYSLDMKDKIVMPFEQVTYMNSGILSEDGSVVFPTIERVAVPVRQLLLMHDAMVIYRITRAPEKLVFNVDLAGMPAKKAEQKVREMAMAHKSRKAVQGSGAVTNVYNAETMLDAYYFWKIGEGQGTQVSSLNSTSHYNEMNDVEYFLKRILKFLSIPWQRWSENAANRQDKMSIQNEEYSFAQSIVRYQTMFAAAVKKTFITHLRMKGLFRKYDLHESEIDVSMNPPALFENYQAQTRFKDALDIVNSAAGLTFLSKNMLLKTVFNFTDSQIKENEVENRRELLFQAQTEWMAEQLKAGKAKANVYLDNERYLDEPQPQMAGAEGEGQMPMGAGGGVPADIGGGQPPPQSDAAGGDAMTPQGGGEIPSSVGDEGGEQQSAGDTMDLGSETQNAAADANFGEFANSSNISQTTADELSLKDDSGKTDAEREIGENPTYGEFGGKRLKETPKAAKRYPETERGVKGLNGIGGESLADMFRDTFGIKNGNEDEKLAGDETLTDVFNKEFKSKVGDSREIDVERKGGRNETLTDVFKNNFGNIDSDRNADGAGGKVCKSMEDVFDDVFGKTVNGNYEHEAEGGAHGEMSPLSKVFDREFKHGGSRLGKHRSMSKVFHREFGNRHAGHYTKSLPLADALDVAIG